MDRGFVFRLINMYIDNFNPADPRILHEYKFEFLRIVCSHEFYIPLCLPIMTRKVKNYKGQELQRSRTINVGHEFYVPLCLPIMTRKVKNYKDLKHDYTLSTEFRRNHFLVGLLLQEVKMSLNESRDIRVAAINTLRNLLAKHAIDDRYQTKAHQARICTLYLPFITVILENKNRLIHNNESQINTPSGGLVNGEASTPDGSIKHIGMVSNSSSVSLEAQSGHSPHHIRVMVRDPGVLAIIAGQVPTPTLACVAADSTKMSDHGSSSSLGSSTSHSSMTTERERDKESREHCQTHQRTYSVPDTTASVSNASYMTCYDKLDHQEVKDMLICFLYIVSNLSEEILLGWFNNSSESDVIDFFDILETCLKYFRYAGHRRIASLCLISDTKRALTLPMKMTQQQLHGHGRSSSTLSDMPLDGLMYGGRSDITESSMEANLSTEVAMDVLDIVCLYTSTFKSQLKFQNGDNPIMRRVFDLHLHFLQTHQSETVLKHAFAALRSFISKVG
ncbi:Dedicator of cytokinesis protein 9 [Lamellibrachia satsuma]|nr:Dedicator of cytokinesis protein 9 [Lamellibrachia satsuma]